MQSDDSVSREALVTVAGWNWGSTGGLGGGSETPEERNLEAAGFRLTVLLPF